MAIPDVPDALIALSEERAAALVGVSLSTLREWASRGLVGATVVRYISTRNTVRLYGFEDLVALLVLKQLRDERSMQAIRTVLERVRQEYDHPLTELRFGVAAGRVYFQHPTGEWEGERPHQTIIKHVLPMRDIRARIRSAAGAERDETQHGLSERRRRSFGRQPVFAGTRIPVANVRSYLEEGASDAEVLEAFPRLSRADIELARRGDAEAAS